MPRLKISTIGPKGLYLFDDEGKEYYIPSMVGYSIEQHHSNYASIKIELRIHNDFLFDAPTTLEKVDSKALMEEVMKRGLMNVIKDYKK